MNTPKLILIRHGESEWNKDNLFCGWYDAPLSEQGISDASKISASALKDDNLKIDCAFTSRLQRAQQSLNIILKELKLQNIPTTLDWHLNERHYGNLTGFNKRQMADKYGEKQVQIWRRSFDIPPPPIDPFNPFYDSIEKNPSFKTVPPQEFPVTESLETVMQRVIPYFENVILKQIADGKNVLIVAHGTIVRALVKHIDNISNDHISSVNIPNSIPCVYEFDTIKLKPIGEINYLADENFLNKQMEKTASIGK